MPAAARRRLLVLRLSVLRLGWACCWGCGCHCCCGGAWAATGRLGNLPLLKTNHVGALYSRNIPPGGTWMTAWATPQSPKIR